MKKQSRTLIAGLLAVVVALSLSVNAAAADLKDGLFERVRAVYNVVEQWHKDGADAEKFTAGAIKGGLEALGDPYTTYFSPDEYKGFLDSLNGSFSGIGAYLEQDGNYVVISSPIKGTPAFKAGLKSGDRILEADGTPLVGATTEKAVSLIRGKAGTPVTLKIERLSEKRTFTITIVREQISIPEVESRMLDKEVGYIQLSTFGDDAVSSFYAAVDAVKKEGARGLVLDLRQNGGGYLNAAIDIASGFVPEGQPVVYEVGKSGKTAAKSTGRLINLPVVVLVDGGTASASEILAGAIQDTGAGPLVGVKTFGKGTVQQILNFSGDGAGIKVTVAEYLTPKERHVHGIGLTPDYVVEPVKPDPERAAPLEVTRLLLPATAGLDVLRLQYRLEDLGYAPDLTGWYGLKTASAIEKFYADNDLTPKDPMVNEAFLAALNAKVAERAGKTEAADIQLDKALELVRTKLGN